MNTFSLYKTAGATDDLVDSLARTLEANDMANTSELQLVDDTLDAVSSIVNSLVKQAEALEQDGSELVDDIDDVLAFIQTEIFKSAEEIAVGEDGLPLVGKADGNSASSVNEQELSDHVDKIVQNYSSGKKLLSAIEEEFSKNTYIDGSASEDSIRNKLEKLITLYSSAAGTAAEEVARHFGSDPAAARSVGDFAFERVHTMLSARSENIAEIAFERMNKKDGYSRRNSLLQEHLEDPENSRLREKMTTV
jgi:hypothetical protein